jgi:hypothetical protein
VVAGGFVVVRDGADGRSGGDRAGGEDVGSEATSVDEGSQVTRPADAFEVGAGLAPAAAPAQDLADGEGAPMRASRSMPRVRTLRRVAVERDGGAGSGELVEDLGGDEGEVVAGTVTGARAEGPGAGGVAVPVEPPPLEGVGDVEQAHVGLGGRGDGERFDRSLPLQLRGRGSEHRVEGGDGVGGDDGRIGGGAAEQVRREGASR